MSMPFFSAAEAPNVRVSTIETTISLSFFIRPLLTPKDTEKKSWKKFVRKKNVVIFAAPYEKRVFFDNIER